MAKKRKPVDKNSASYQYKKQWERINNYIKELEKQGYTVDETDLPTKKKKPVMKSVENLKHDWSYRALKKIAYKTFPDTNGGEFKVSKSEFEYQRYLQKQEAKKRERKAKKENRPTKKPSIPKNKMSFTHYVMEKPSSNESENIAKEFEDSLKNLGVQAQVEETETEEVKYVPIEEVGISRTDVYSGWKHVGREDGMDVFQPKKINEKIYVDLMSGKFFVK